jgi:hypothetical protein
MQSSARRLSLVLAGCGLAVAAALPALPAEIWARGFGGPGRERATGVAPDRGGTVYVAGQIAGEATLGTLRVTSAGEDALVAALDVHGKPVWAYALGGPGADEARAVAILPEGDVFVVGSFSATADFDPGAGRTELASAGGTDVFVLRLTRDGALVWARRLGGPGVDTGLDIAVDGRGVSVAGSFQGAFDTGAGRLAGAGKTDGFVAQLDLAGTTLWAQAVGGPQEDDVRSVAVEPNGEIWIGGSFEAKAALGSAGAVLESAGKSDGFLARLGTGGSVLWSGRIGGKREDAVTAVAPGGGGAWFTGFFTGTADFDPGPSITSMSGVGKADGFVARFVKTGQLRWVQQIGGPDDDTGTGLAPDGDGGVWSLSVQIQRAGFHLDPASTDDRALLTRFDRDGGRKVSRDLAGEGGLRALDVALDSAGNPCVAGSFRGKATVVTGFEVANLPGAGQTDALVARIVR